LPAPSESQKEKQGSELNVLKYKFPAVPGLDFARQRTLAVLNLWANTGGLSLVTAFSGLKKLILNIYLIPRSNL
jgi:hypothetical protein